MRLRCPCVLACLLALAALPAAAAARAPAYAGPRAAERALWARVARSIPRAVRVTCDPVRKGWRCDWTGERALTRGRSELCSGRQRVSRSRGSWRFRRLWRNCHVHRPPATPARPQPPGTPSTPEAPAPPKPPAPPTPPVSPPPRVQHFGFSEHVESQPDRHAALGAAVGADSQRLTMPWNWAEPYPDRYALEGFDSTYRASIAKGIRPLITILFSPWWTWSRDVRCDPSRDYCPYPPDPAFYDQWREFVAIVARRYPKALGIEIWNEQNLTAFWRPLPDPGRYSELLRQAYTAVKGVDPSMPVISGGLANNDPSADGNISYIEFLRGMYQSGAKPSMDGVGIHPYNPGIHSSFLEGTLANVRGVRDSFGDRSKPLWVTEVGLTTSGNPWPRAWSEEEQATGLALQYRALAGMTDVQGVFLHTLVEPPLDRPGSPEPGYGVVRRDFTPKPAYCAIASARGASGVSGCG